MRRHVVIYQGEAVAWVNAPSAEAAILRVHEETGRPLHELSAAECSSRRFRPG